MVRAVNICMMSRRALVAEIAFHSSFHNWKTIQVCGSIVITMVSVLDNRLLSYFEMKSSETRCKAQE